MPNRDRWIGPRDRDLDRPERRVERPDDLGQADYSADYGYDPRTRSGYRAQDDYEDLNDYGQADYSEDYAYDDRNRAGYRRDDPQMRRAYDDDAVGGARRDWRGGEYDDRRESRSWMDQARDGVSSFFGPRAGPDPRSLRRERHGRVTWAVITGRMDHERGFDPSDIEVIVEGTEVMLNGTVRDREEKRRAEDLADVRGVTHVQNNLRIRRHRGWF